MVSGLVKPAVQGFFHRDAAQPGETESSRVMVVQWLVSALLIITRMTVRYRTACKPPLTHSQINY